MPPEPRARPLPAALRLFVGVSLAIFVPTWALAIATIGTRSRHPMLFPFLSDKNHFFDFEIFYPRFAAAGRVDDCARVRHWGFPYDWPLFPWGNSFFDYLTFFDRFDDLHTAAVFKGDDRQFSYFAPGVLLYQFFYVFRRKQWRFQRLPGFGVFLATILAGVAWGFRRMRPFLLTAGAIMLVLYFLRIRTLPIANQVLILSLCGVLLPPSSYDYTLLQLYGAWGVLVWVAINATRTGRRVRSLGANFVLLALVFTPSNFVAWRGFSYNGSSNVLCCWRCWCCR